MIWRCSGAGTDGEYVIGQRDTAFQLAIEGEVLGSALDLSTS
jgi:hypothetical protein